MTVRGAYDPDRRLKGLILFVFAVSGIIVWRLFQKSVTEHPLYSARAELQYEVAKDLPSKRGTILAQDAELGQLVPLAATEERFDISVVPKNVKDKAVAAHILSSLFGVDEKDVLAKVSTDKLYLPPIVRGVTKDQRNTLVGQGFAGLLIEKRNERVYPENQIAAQVLGFVNREGKGSYGVEGYYDVDLRGTAGSVVGEKDTLGRIISTLKQTDPENGIDIELTIDHNLQFAVERRLQQGITDSGAVSGQAIIMNPTNGEILSMASLPSFDPNKYADSAAEPEKFRNPTISTVYEPGSIFKPLVMASAIDLGKIEPDTQESFNAFVTVQGYEIHTALNKAYGNETMTQVLENSDNVGMVWVSGKMTKDEMHDKLASLGINQTTGVDLQGEVQGSFMPARQWQSINQATMSFGQGVSVTPLQMIRAWSAVINGGTLVTPHVVRSLEGRRGVIVPAELPTKSGIISTETSAKVRGMLQSVVDHGPYGHARVAGYSIGGKTGTAQIADNTGNYSETDFTHTFMGFFPVDAPRFIILVKLDKPTSAPFAESTVGPVFHDLAQYIFNYYKIPPTVK
jgi:cell division protein FtsI/penicillin-binding protein 2